MVVNNVNNFYKSLFGVKTYKLSLDAGCTCPTRDGTLGTGGCIFCNAAGSGDFIPKKCDSITQQVNQAKQIVAPKLKGQSAKYIAYFQSFTNTYGNLEKLTAMWEEALTCDDVVGIAIGTRPDCLSAECLKYLGSLADRTYVQIELGFQTSNENSAEYIHRGFPNHIYFEAVKNLHKANSKIHVVTHLIFGLPGEKASEMMDSVKTVVKAGSDGIKITSLYVLRGTELATDYENGKFKSLEMEEYFDLLTAALKLIPEKMIVHRLTGDPPKKELIAPMWPANKKLVISRINKLM